MAFAGFCKLIGLDLEPFQRKIATAAAGPERELLISLPRGQGKTTLLAGVALHHLVTVDRAEVYCAAASQPQARILYEDCVRFARELDHPNIVLRHHEIRWRPDPARFASFTRIMRVLPAVPLKLHGLTPSLALIDELHAVPDNGVYEAMKTAQHKRPGSRLVTISTAGVSAGAPPGPGRALPRVTVRGALHGRQGWRILEDVGLVLVPDDGDIDDMRLVKTANPASWISIASLREQRAAVPEGAFERYHCNQWAAGEGAWIPPGSWQACIGEPTLADGERIWIESTSAASGATVVVWISERRHVGCWIGHGDQAILDARDVIHELAERYRVVQVAADPWRAGGQVIAEPGQRGIRTSQVAQSDKLMVPASQALYLGRSLTM